MIIIYFTARNANTLFNNAFFTSGLSLIVNFFKQNLQNSRALRMMNSPAFTSGVAKPFTTSPSPTDYDFP